MVICDLSFQMSGSFEWCLLEAIETLVKLSDVVGSLCVDEAFWLGDVDLLGELGM